MAKKPDDFPVDDEELDDAKEAAGGPDTEAELVDDEAEGESPDKVAEKLEIFGARLAVRRDEWVTGRATQGHDRRMQEDLDQYNGRDSANRNAAEMMTSVEQGFPVTTRNAKATRSTVFVQVSRQKTNALAARWQDIGAPNDERNFAVAPTPIPGLPTFVHVPSMAASPPAQPAAAPSAPSAGGSADGAPPIGGPQQASAAPTTPDAGQAAPQGAPAAPPSELTPEEQALVDKQAEAKKRADAMQQEIDDDFEECDINAEYRKSMFDAALFGTGVMKGPQVIHRTRKAWTNNRDALGNDVWTMDVVKEIKPASYRIDPRKFYPDPLCGENVQNSRGVFEYDRKTKAQVKALAKQPGYIPEQLKKVITEGAQPSKALRNMDEMEDRDMVRGDLYDHWIYWGEVDPEDLEAAGIDVGDELDTVSACIEMVNSTVVRAYLNPLPDGALPYDMVPCERVPGSVWGVGVPYLMRSQQRVINAAWRMILDNAGVSSGPQIVLDPTVIRPADGQNTLTSRKIWYSTGAEDVRKAFTTFEFNSHQAELAAIIEMADRLSDQETAVPMLAQGQQGSAPETVGGMQILMQGANVMLRRLVKQFDDYVIKPHVRRYYDFHMEYSEKSEIKGDFQVVALGSSTLVVRDIQNQAYQNLLAMGTNPAYSVFINTKKLFMKALEASHIAPRDIMNTEAEIQEALQRAAQQQQPDPRIVAAEKRAESDQMRTKAMLDMNAQTLQSKQAIANDQLSVQERIAQLDHESSLMKLAHQRQDTLDNIRSQLAQTSMKERVKQDMHAAELQAEAARGTPATTQ